MYFYEYVSMLKATVISNTIMNVATLALRLLIVWNLNISVKRKIAVSGMTDLFYNIMA